MLLSVEAGRVNWPAVHGRALQIDNTKFNYCKSEAGKRTGCIYQEESASFIRAGIPSQCMCGQVLFLWGPNVPRCGDIENLSETTKEEIII